MKMRTILIRVTVLLSLGAIQIVQLQPGSSQTPTKKWPHNPYKVNSIQISSRKHKVHKGYRGKRGPRPTYKGKYQPAWKPPVIYDPYLLPAVPALIGETGAATLLI